MKRRRTRRALASVIVFLFAPFFSALAAEVGPGEALYYWNGPARVDVALALDELVVDSDTLDSATRIAKSARAVPQKGDGRSLLVKIDAMADKTRLRTKAKELAALAGVSNVYAVLYEPQNARTELGVQTLTHQLSLKLRAGANLAALAAKYGFNVIEKVSYSPNTFIVEAAGDDPLDALLLANQLYEKEKLEWATPLIRRQRIKRFTPDDPFFAKQWHLQNDGTQVPGAVAGNDVNIVSVWDTYDGTGVNIGIVDDGLEVAHEDLSSNARTDIDIDINYSDSDPTPDKSVDNHGTAVAGVAAARGNNTTGVTGAAFKAGLVGIRILSAGTTDAQEAQAMTHQATATLDADCVHVSSNSWGESDDGTVLGRPGPLMLAARQEGVTEGRGGKGIVYVWAGGNGQANSDDSNYDAYNSSPFVIAVAASNAAGAQSFYSENGCDLLINAPSDDTGTIGITTTDRSGASGYNSVALGNNNYTDTFGGTSAATPLVSGIVALILQANPALTWRDVRHILVETAVKNSPGDGSWFNNADGKHFSHKFGFGRIDAAAATTLATTWSSVSDLSTPLSASESPGANIPDNNSAGLSRGLTISASNTFKAETVSFTVNVTHPRRSDLRFRLVSPGGSVSEVSRRVNDNHANLSNFTFTTVANWGENPNGTWTLITSDEASGSTGKLTSWSIQIDGTGGSSGPPPPPPPKADIQITAITLPNSPILLNQPVDITVTVANNGGSVAAEFSLALFLNQSSAVIDGTNANATQIVSGPLEIDESRDIVFSGITYSAVGDVTLALLADADNAIEEDDENNNMSFQPLTVLNHGVDLVISSITKLESTPGLNAQFDITIRNLGAVDSSGFSTAFYGNLFAAPAAADLPDTARDVNILNSNDSITLTFNLPTQNTPRGGRAWFFVDCNNLVAESIESNNIASIVWGVANGAPEITSPAEASVPVASAGESVTFSVGVSDPNGDPLGYFWDFGDGTTQLGGSSIAHAYATAGFYTVTVTFSDGPFHSQTTSFTMEIFSDIVDLGTVSLGVKRGRIKLTAPKPAVFGPKERPKSVIVAGDPGAKVRFSNFKLNGTAKVVKTFDFTVEHSVKKTGHTVRVRYRYKVVP